MRLDVSAISTDIAVHVFEIEWGRRLGEHRPPLAQGSIGGNACRSCRANFLRAVRAGIGGKLHLNSTYWQRTIDHYKEALKALDVLGVIVVHRCRQLGIDSNSVSWRMVGHHGDDFDCEVMFTNVDDATLYKLRYS